MTTHEFKRLSAHVRSLLLQYAVTRKFKDGSSRSSALKSLGKNFSKLDHLERNFSSITLSPTFAGISICCAACDPLDLTTFPAKIALVWEQFEILVPAPPLLASSSTSRSLAPITDETIGFLQTQSVNVSNRFKALKAKGADIDDLVYEPLAKEASLAASVLLKRLKDEEVSIKYNERELYKGYRLDTISAPAKFFLEDLEKLRDYLLKLLRAAPVLIA